MTIRFIHRQDHDNQSDQCIVLYNSICTCHAYFLFLHFLSNSNTLEYRIRKHGGCYISFSISVPIFPLLPFPPILASNHIQILLSQVSLSNILST